MAYATITQLEARLGSPLYARLTDRANGATASAIVAQEIVDEAEAIANGHLGRRFATPINLSAHPELADILAARVLDLAEYLAWRGSPFVADIPERVRLVSQEAIRWFESVASGQHVLPAAGPPASSSSVGDTPMASGPARQFTRTELDGL